MADYFYMGEGIFKNGLDDEDRRTRVHTESYRYLATKKTREELEICRNNKYTGDVKTLIFYINKDIKCYSEKLQELEGKLKE